jgi:hypothetical protein
MNFWTDMILRERINNTACVCTALSHVTQGRGVHVTGVSAAYTFKLNKNILSE